MMRPVLMSLVTLLALSSPSLAAPPAVEDFCFDQIEKVRPPLSSGRGDREAFMANCIADFTGTPPKKLNRYKKLR
jgi:hypothetical protein